MSKQGKKSKAKATDTIEKVINTLMKSDIQSAKFGRYVIDGDRLVYRQAIVSELHIQGEAINKLISQIEAGNAVLINRDLNELKNLETASVKVRHLAENVIAKRIRQGDKVLFAGNSRTLDLIGRKVSFGRVNKNRYKTEIQQRLESRMPMLDFKFFDSDGSDLKAQVEGWKRISEQTPGYGEEKIVSY